MIYHCLNLNEYHDLIKVNIFDGKRSADLENVHEIFDACKYWDSHVAGFNYFLSISFERLMKTNLVNETVIDQIYEWECQSNFQIIEGDEDFIEQLLRSEKFSPTNSLEDSLVDLQNISHG